LFFPSLPFSSSSSAAFPFPFCSDLDGVSFQDLTSFRVSIVFLNSHGPLSFTSHCPSRFVLFFFCLLSLSSKPHSPSPVCVFPGSFLFGSFSSLSVWVYWWFLSVPVLLSSIHFPFSFSLGSFLSLFSFCYFSASPLLLLSPLFLPVLSSLLYSSLLFFSPSRAGVQSPFIGGKGSGASLWLHGERGSAGRLASGCD